VKINGGGSIKPTTTTPGVQDVASAKQPAAPGPVASPTPGVKVEITSISAQLQQIEKILNDVSVLDSARVEAIKQAIREGRFRVDSEVVADKLLASVREFLLAQQKG
jgi:negative regulator of flagellin synthesis FlgM